MLKNPHVLHHLGDVGKTVEPSLVVGWHSCHSLSFVVLLGTFFAYLAVAGSILPGKVVPGAKLPDSTMAAMVCLVSLLLLVALLGLGIIAETGLELLSTTFIFSTLVTMVIFAAECKAHNNSSSQASPLRKPHLQLVLILYQLFCMLYILGYFVYEEWDIIVDRLGFMLVFGDLVWIPFTFGIQVCRLEEMNIQYVWNNVKLTTAVVANCLYMVFWGANKQKHVFKGNPKHLHKSSSKSCRGKLLASGYWGIVRHCNYLGELLLALSFSLPCGLSSPVPYFYPVYLPILLIWRERGKTKLVVQKSTVRSGHNTADIPQTRSSEDIPLYLLDVQ
ncbi:hypothetical protein ACJRO7_001352 [Eucalyptus globulus]|uniref:Uncharacterized protein n=1 Tax=Eucalyptus globulus TaxID=34317 RepID=A0ABD3LQL6_EUCGL